MRAQKSSLEGDRDGRSSYEELELKRKAVAKAAPSKVRESGQSPDRIKPQPPTTRKPSGGRPDPLVVLPRLVQSDQTNVRNKKIDNIGSRDDSNEYNDEDRPKRKRKKPLFMRLQAKAERQAGEIEREKMAAYALLREQKKLAQPSHQDLLEHRQKYAELKKEEEQRKKEAREYRENEWRNMQQMLQQKNEAVVPHVPSHSPLKRNASDVNASDDESLHSHVSQKKKKRPRRRSRAASDVTGDEDSIDSAARREDDLYLPNIVSPAKLSPRGIGKARRAKRREEENSNDGENQAPSNLNHAINEGESPPRVPKKEKKQVRLPPDVRPEPIHTEDSVDSNGNHVRFAENATRKSHDSDVSHDSKSSLTVANVPILRGPQYLAELLEPDQQEEDLAKMYETGFEMQMVERGMMETPSAAKALAGAQGRVPR